MSLPHFERTEILAARLRELVKHAKLKELTAQDEDDLEASMETFIFMMGELEAKGATVRRLRNWLFGASTEKLRDILGAKLNEARGPGETADGPTELQDGAARYTGKQDKAKPKGHGRNGAAAYEGAPVEKVAHESLKPRDLCPDCQDGKVYRTVPKVLVRVVGQAPLQATVYEFESLRCNLCGRVFSARPPPGVGERKYDETAASMIAVLKYGTGLPFYRLQRLQGGLKLPLPSSTQWDIVEGAARLMEPAYEELQRQAAQGELLHNDDTNMKVLSLSSKTLIEDASPDNERTGVFTSGIVSVGNGRLIVLFFTGHNHAGENLASVLARRDSELGKPMQMCDALSRNLPKPFETIVANCLSHSRRKYVDVFDAFPAECRYVLEVLRDVYHNDTLARERQLSPDERLKHHQLHSRPAMDELKGWIDDQFREHKVEPNSGLGGAMQYMVNHWEKLTLFLRKPGAPLDNNICERTLKKAILHRKNSLFYKTLNGARVGDLYMTLIHTAELANVDPFEYLIELQRHAAEVAENPEAWMPWNYQERLVTSDAA